MMELTSFARSLSAPRPSVQNWERKYSRLAQASQRQPPASANLPNVGSRGYRLTLSGSGRKAATFSIEDALCVFIKDERRLEHTVTIDGIIEMATDLMPK
ncbi:hypothetical protein PHYPSEUDO_009860 [Phytophthora pseudosyringae]|uniref:Uncharacterized protein n=1 Tax=Phytophthora pseudosyringae TaxID=221518 RepID=A0A8T1WDJ4_9STRA|nr:hypothetical protein PHYPSEUDO_009860 [Phytophthora pseudosyringae]